MSRVPTTVQVAAAAGSTGTRSAVRSPPASASATAASTALAAASWPSDQRSIIAEDRIVPSGLATSRPAMSGADPWMGSYRPWRPWAVDRVPSEAEGNMPSEPAITAASSDRMSPNRFSVTITSKLAGHLARAMAAESTSRCSRLTSGKSAWTSSVTLRHSREVASTLALSTWVSWRRRPRASSNARVTIRRISPSVYHRVSIAARPSGVSRGSEGLPK